MKKLIIISLVFLLLKTINFYYRYKKQHYNSKQILNLNGLTNQVSKNLSNPLKVKIFHNKSKKFNDFIEISQLLKFYNNLIILLKENKFSVKKIQYKPKSIYIYIKKNYKNNNTKFIPLDLSMYNKNKEKPITNEKEIKIISHKPLKSKVFINNK